MRVPLVIFDCDGVLVDSEPIAARVLAEALTHIGLSYDPVFVDQRFRGKSLADVIRSIEAELTHPLPPKFLTSLNEATFAAFDRELTPVEGVAAALERIVSAGAEVCVASSGSHEKIRHSLRLTKLLPFFGERLFSASEVKRGKPAPDLFEHAARSMGRPIEESWVVEDSLPGIEGGVSAGARVLGYVCPSLRDRKNHELLVTKLGATVFSSMARLPSLVGLV